MYRFNTMLDVERMAGGGQLAADEHAGLMAQDLRDAARVLVRPARALWRSVRPTAHAPAGDGQNALRGGSTTSPNVSTFDTESI